MLKELTTKQRELIDTIVRKPSWINGFDMIGETLIIWVEDGVHPDILDEEGDDGINVIPGCVKAVIELMHEVEEETGIPIYKTKMAICTSADSFMDIREQERKNK